MTARIAAALLCLILSLPATLSAGAPEEETYPLDRVLKLDVWGGTLENIASDIRKQTGVELVFYRPDFPPEKESRPVYIVTGDVSLRLVMECLARFFGCRYRLSEKGRIEMATGYGWVGQDFVVRFNDLDPLIRPGDGVAEAALGLREFLRVIPLLSGNYSFTIEESPAPDGKRSAKAVTILPPLLADYFDKAVRCLKEESGDLAQTGNPGPGASRAAQIERTSWSSLLAANFDIEAGLADPVAIIREICSRIDVIFMLNGRPGQEAARSGLLAGRTSFGRATEELSGIFGLNRRVFLNPGAVIFEPGKVGEWEEDCKSREFFWTGLVVAGFDIKSSMGKLGGDALLGRLRNEVYPHVWLDPMCSLTVNSATGRLATMAPANVVEALAVALRNIENETNR